MDDSDDKVESSTEVPNASTYDNNTIADLNGQIEELKRELESVKKKLLKTEFERDNALKNAENLKSEVKELSKKLQEERKKKLENKRKDDSKRIQDEEASRLNQNKTTGRSDAPESKDLRASLEEAAADAMVQSGFVFDNRTGLYYDWNTGYYYDPNSRLYYENTTGVYYYYDEHSATYKFHSKVDLTTSKQETACKDDTNGQEEKESGEELSEDEEESDKDVEITEVQFPCIRAIVIKSEKLKVGTLFIITYTGGTIGREKDLPHVMRIPDIEVSKVRVLDTFQ